MQNEIRTVEKVIDVIVDFFVNYSFQVVGAIIVLVVGMIAARLVVSFLMQLFERKNLDVTLSKFVADAVKVSILAFAVIIALGKFGITIAPFIAALAAMAFGASFAIQGPLSN
jgi:small conductance mechanosensitive channel